MYINQIKTIKSKQRSSMNVEKKKTANNKLQQTDPIESPSGILGRHVDPAHFDQNSHKKHVLSKPCKTGILYQGSVLGSRRRTTNLNFPRQLHRVTRVFSFPLAGGRTSFARPRRKESKRSNWHILNAPFFHDL